MTHRQNPDIVARSVAGENLLVPVSGPLARRNSLFTLNAIGYEIWQQLDGTRSDDEVVQTLVDRYPEDAVRVRSEAALFLQEMTALGVVTLVGVSA